MSGEDKMATRPQMKIMAFDPGGTTGWAKHLLLSPEELYRWAPGAPPDVWSGGQLDQDYDTRKVAKYSTKKATDNHPSGHHCALWDLLAVENPDVVVVENFVYEVRRNQGVDQPGIVLISRDYIGVIELWCKMTMTPMMVRTRNALKMWDDEKLKKLGLYTKGARHRNDATRHLLDYIVTTLGRTDYLKPLKPSAPE